MRAHGSPPPTSSFKTRWQFGFQGDNRQGGTRPSALETFAFAAKADVLEEMHPPRLGHGNARALCDCSSGIARSFMTVAGVVLGQYLVRFNDREDEYRL